MRVRIRYGTSMRVMTRTAALLIFGLSAFCAGQSGASGAEVQLFTAVNRARGAARLPALHWNAALAAAARRHAGIMAQRGSAEHGFAGEPTLASRATQAGARFVWLSENVAQGRGVAIIQEQFLKSPRHRANMLDSDMDSVGIGIVRRGRQLFAVEDFSKAKTK